MTAEILLGIVTGLLANELCEFGPWCARKLVRWSAFRQYTNPGRAEMRAEELTALINDRPGNLFKLITAVCFATNAIIVCGRRAIAREPDADRGVLPLPTGPDQEERQRLVVDWTRCRGHGLCAHLVPELMHLDAQGYPVILNMPVPNWLEKDAQQAVDMCPALALGLSHATPPQTALR